MNYRKSKILAETYVTANGTDTIDINLADPISRIQVLCRARAGSWPVLGHPCQCFTKIELVDGADVLASLSGKEAYALDYYQTGQQPYSLLDYLQGAYAEVTLNLNFGRWLFDPLLGLDPAKFRNLQLKLTHAYQAGGCTTDRLYYSVWADLFDEKRPGLTGMLLGKEHIALTTGAGTTQYVDLPTDLPIKMIMLESRADDDGPHDQYESVKITEEFDKRIIIDADILDVIRMVMGDYPMIIETGSFATTAGLRDYDIAPGYETNCVVSGGQALVVYGAAGYKHGSEISIIGSGNGQLNVHSRGWCPHNAVPFVFGDPKDPADWWDVSKVGSARMKITSGSGANTSADTCVVIQQLKSY